MRQMTFVQYDDNERNIFKRGNKLPLSIYCGQKKPMRVKPQQHIDKNDLLDAGSKYPPKKEKAPEKYLWSLFILVPRNRIELPTRGFSDLNSENPYFV